MKNSHLQAKVNPTKVFGFLKYIKSLGNPFYSQITETLDQYEARCQQDDPDGFDLLFGREANNILTIDFVEDSASEPILELEEYFQLVREVVCLNS